MGNDSKSGFMDAKALGSLMVVGSKSANFRPWRPGYSTAAKFH